MAVVGTWTGHEAKALRCALRMTVQLFAERIGVAVRTAAYWESRGAAVRPQPDTQAALDTLLTRCDADTDARFRFLCGSSEGSLVSADEVRQTPQELIDLLLDRLAQAGAADFTRPDQAGEAVRRALREATRLKAAITTLPTIERQPIIDLTESRLTGGDGMDRRAVVRLFGTLGVVAAGSGTADRLLAFNRAEAATGFGRVGEELLSGMREVTQAYAQAWGVAPVAELARLTRAHLNAVVSHLEAATGSSLRARLGSVAAETAALAGWLTCLQDRRGEARSLFLLALDSARDAQDDTLHALALGSLAYLDSPVPRGAAGGSRTAVRRLEQALTLLPADASSAARSWLHAQLAVEHAALGDAKAFDRAIGLAEAAALSPQDALDSEVFGQRGILTFWGPEGVGVTKSRGLGWSLLGHARAADTIAPTVKAGGTALGEATLLLDLAAGQVRAGQFEPACETNMRALELLSGGGYAARVRRVRGLRAQVIDDSLPAVRDLDERLAHA